MTGAATASMTVVLIIPAHRQLPPHRSPNSRKGMPQELEEKYYGNEQYTFINVSSVMQGNAQLLFERCQQGRPQLCASVHMPATTPHLPGSHVRTTIPTPRPCTLSSTMAAGAACVHVPGQDFPAAALVRHLQAQRPALGMTPPLERSSLPIAGASMAGLRFTQRMARHCGFVPHKRMQLHSCMSSQFCCCCQNYSPSTYTASASEHCLPVKYSLCYAASIRKEQRRVRSSFLALAAAAAFAASAAAAAAVLPSNIAASFQQLPRGVVDCTQHKEEFNVAE